MLFKILHTKLNIFVPLLIFQFVTSIGSAILTGIVYQSQTGKPLENVMVELKEQNKTVFTDSSGIFLFDSVQPGSFNIHFYHQNSEPLYLNNIFVSGKETRQLIVRLNPVVSSLDKMIVHGRAFRRAPQMCASTKTISRDQITRLPGASIDIQRATYTLPNVTSAADNTNEIIVRGGHQDENLLILDNIEIPNANHFAVQGSGGGLISLISPLQINSLTFSSGAPPAMYGGKASSVLDIELRDGNNDVVSGGLDIGLAGVSFHLEGPLWNHSTFMTTVTKSFLDMFASYSKTTAVPQYWSAQGKLTQILGDHKIKANIIFGDNRIEIKNARETLGTNGNILKSGGKVYVSGINWDGYWGDRFSTKVTVSATGNTYKHLERIDSSSILESDSDIIDTLFSNNSFEQEQVLKIQGAVDILRSTKLEAGISVKRCDFNINLFEKDDTVKLSDSTFRINGSEIKDHKIAYKYGAFISGIFYPFKQMKIVPGIRYDMFTYNHSEVFSPRIGFVYSLSPYFDLTSAFGIQYQNPNYSNLLATPANNNLKPKKATTATIGTEYLFEKIAAKLVLEGFLKQYVNLPVESSLITEFDMDKSDTLLSIGRGLSYGLEFFFQKNLTRNFFCTFAYSLSQSEMDDFREGHKGEWLRTDFDFRNAVTVTGGYKAELLQYDWYKKIKKTWWLKALSPIVPFADRIEISAKWRFLGGRPYTYPEYNEDLNRWVFLHENYNQSHYPDYHKLDLRFERRYAFDFLQLTYYLDLQNIYNRHNIWNYFYSSSNGKESTTPIYQLEFFPSGGVIIGF